MKIITDYQSMTQRFVDQLEGEKVANTWMTGIIDELKPTEPLLELQERSIAIDQHIVDGRIIILWNNERMVAIANIMRTPINYTQITLQRVSAR